MWSYRYWELKLWLANRLGCRCDRHLEARFLIAQNHCRMKVLS